MVAASAPLFDNSPFISLLVLLCFADCIQNKLPSFLGISPWFDGYDGSFFRNEDISSYSCTAPGRSPEIKQHFWRSCIDLQ
jgi:hypothetical protein